ADIVSSDSPNNESYTLSLHDALPIFRGDVECDDHAGGGDGELHVRLGDRADRGVDHLDLDLVDGELFEGLHQRIDGALHVRLQRSEEHTSELQSRENLVCLLLLENNK